LFGEKKCISLCIVTAKLKTMTMLPDCTVYIQDIYIQSYFYPYLTCRDIADPDPGPTFWIVSELDLFWI
jgi:hypothetical protein